MKPLLTYSKRTILVIIAITLIGNVYGQFSGGSGTLVDPYKITTLSQLDSMKYYLSSNFELLNDIDASVTLNWNSLTQRGIWQINTDYNKYDFIQYDNGSGLENYYCVENHNSGASFTSANWIKTILNAGDYLGFEPIGYSPNPLSLSIPTTTPFTGSLNGNYHKISNLYIYRIEEHNAGLFGYVYNANTEIKNIGIVDGTLYCIWQGGLLVGWNRRGTIKNCYSTGLVTTYSTIGGGFLGGLVGRNGYTEIGANIYTSYSKANVIGIQGLSSNYIGGLVGANNANISDSYARGAVVGDNRVGGLSGANYGATIINCYSTGSVTANSEYGGLIGAYAYTVYNSYWDTQTSGLTYSSGGIGKTTAEMTFPYDVNTFNSWNFDYIWLPDSATAINDGYPLLYATEISQFDETICQGDSISYGGLYYSNSGNYIERFGNYPNYDSVLLINLQVASHSFNNIIENACGSYTSPSGNYIWNVSGEYTDTIPNLASCDSVITINLTVNTVDATVTQNLNELTANELSAKYQWLDCNNNYAVIANDTNQIFVASENGSYAVEVTLNNCVDTSMCYTLTTVDISEITTDNFIVVYPNPTNGYVLLDLGKESKNTNIYVKDIHDKLLQSFSFCNQQKVELNINEPSGVYFINIITESENKTIKLIKY